MNAVSKICFHCGEPVPKNEVAIVLVRGIEKPVCCIGCQAVANLVLHAGLDRFYAYRNKVLGKPVDENKQQEQIAQWHVYDSDELLSEISRCKESDEREAIFSIEGIYCSSCTWLIEHVLKKQTGVRDVQINPITGRIHLQWNQSQIKLSALLGDISALGYSVHILNTPSTDSAWLKERRQSLKRLFVAGIGMMQVMMYAVALYVGAFQDMDDVMRDFFRWVSFLIATPVVFYSAQTFFKNAFQDLRYRRLGMDVPVALAMSGAYLASVWLTVTRGADVYYDSVLMFIFFLLLGRFAENNLRQRIREQTDALSKLLPMTITRLEGDDKHIKTALLASVKQGDVILVNAGDIIPTDGFVEKGYADINESLLTGESRPVKKSENDSVLGGSINTNGELHIRVTAIGQDTMLSKISYLLQRTQSDKPRLVRLADRVAAWFVIVILLIATLTGYYWWQRAPQEMLSIVLSVLIVSCPCALSLATPVALAVASSRFLKSGLLVAQADAIEVLSRASSIVFDKTGTLTEGNLNITDVSCYGNADEISCMKIAAALEQSSRHPIASAFVSECNQLKLYTVDDIKAIAGEGVEGFIEGKRYRIGTKSFVLADIKESDNTCENSGTQVYLADDNGLLCRFTLNDKIRDETAETLSILSASGLKVCVASGDSVNAVQGFVSRLPSSASLQETIARLKPADKLDYIKALQSRGEIVVMVGDGINDAPVLAAADVSIAMNTGTALAQSASSIVLLGEKLLPITEAVQLAKRTRSIVKQNIAWALLYNAVAIPLAASGLIAPWLAAIGMSLSSLLVLANALRLLNAKINSVQHDASVITAEAMA